MSDSKDLDYEIVRGMPAQVEARVQELLMEEGFELNGPLFPFELDGQTIVVQSVVRRA